MIKKLRFNEADTKKLSRVIRSSVVRDKLNEFRDMYYNKGIYEEEFNGEIFPHEITDVRCTIDDVYDVVGNPGIYDVICHADIRWDYDEELDTTGTEEMFSFYYDPENDVIVDDSEIVGMEDVSVPLVGEKRNTRMRTGIRENKRKLKEDRFDTWDDLTHDLFNAVAKVLFKYRNRDITSEDFRTAMEFVTDRFDDVSDEYNLD